MTNYRKPVFQAIREGVRAITGEENIFNDAGNRLALDNLLDAFGFPVAEHKRELSNRKLFFDKIRAHVGSLTQVQVDTINGLLDGASHWPIGWVAYGLATAWHECRFKPIDEIGKGKGKAYGKPGARMKKIPNPPLYGGQIPYGRGLVQLTWCDNYEWADKECAEAGLTKPGEILADFDLVKRPDIAAFILIRGMETGAFTSRKLSDYIAGSGTLNEFIQARRVINGTDRAELIANYALWFKSGLAVGGWG